ncbi:hypothetical protein B0H13DRAFT_1933775 [Mycena leptocephala]|nr:hypothetical protein B0H13DRAFT_1933775 [Mycena leptocephala]
MQYTVNSEQFDGDWDAMVEILLQMGMAVIIAQTVVAARLVQRIVHVQVLNEHESIFGFSVWTTKGAVIIFINKWLYRCYVIWGFRKKIVIVPVLLMLSTFVTGIMGAAAQPLNVSDVRISGSLAVATNLFLTAGRIIWIRRAASHVGLDNTVRNRYTTAIGMMYGLVLYPLPPDMTSRLESGAIYCLASIFLLVTISRNDPRIFDIAIGIGQQLIVSPGNFRRAVYPAYLPPEHNTHVHTGIAFRSGAVPLSQPCEVLDIKPQSTEGKDGECV